MNAYINAAKNADIAAILFNSYLPFGLNVLNKKIDKE